MEGWKKVLHLLHLLHESDARIAFHLIIMIIDALINDQGLTIDDIPSHGCNLVVKILSKFSMIARIESLFNKLHSYFCCRTSSHFEL